MTVSQFYLDEKAKIEKLSSMKEVNEKYRELRKAMVESPYANGQVVDMDEFSHWNEMNLLIDGPLQDMYWKFKGEEQ